MDTDEIAFATQKTVRLVKEYEKIINKYAQQSYVFESILMLCAKCRKQPKGMGK